MPRMSDAARMAALEGMGGGGGAMPPEMAAPEEMGAEEMPGGDIEGGIAMIEGALTGAPPDVAEEARAHINALREIASKIGGGEAPPEEAPAEPEMPPVSTEVQ